MCEVSGTIIGSVAADKTVSLYANEAFLESHSRIFSTTLEALRLNVRPIYPKFESSSQCNYVGQAGRSEMNAIKEFLDESLEVGSAEEKLNCESILQLFKDPDTHWSKLTASRNLIENPACLYDVETVPGDFVGSSTGNHQESQASNLPVAINDPFRFLRTGGKVFAFEELDALIEQDIKHLTDCNFRTLSRMQNADSISIVVLIEDENCNAGTFREDVQKYLKKNLRECQHLDMSAIDVRLSNWQEYLQENLPGQLRVSFDDGALVCEDLQVVHKAYKRLKEVSGFIYLSDAKDPIEHNYSRMVMSALHETLDARLASKVQLAFKYRNL